MKNQKSVVFFIRFIYQEQHRYSISLVGRGLKSICNSFMLIQLVHIHILLYIFFSLLKTIYPLPNNTLFNRFIFLILRKFVPLYSLNLCFLLKFLFSVNLSQCNQFSFLPQITIRICHHYKLQIINTSQIRQKFL